MQSLPDLSALSYDEKDEILGALWPTSAQLEARISAHGGCLALNRDGSGKPLASAGLCNPGLKSLHQSSQRSHGGRALCQSFPSYNVLRQSSRLPHSHCNLVLVRNEALAPLRLFAFLAAPGNDRLLADPPNQHVWRCAYRRVCRSHQRHRPISFFSSGVCGRASSPPPSVASPAHHTSDVRRTWLWDLTGEGGDFFAHSASIRG